jgi:putative FmdB family regulatory protein
MATYDYECRTCGIITEHIHSMSAAPQIICDACGDECSKVILSAPAAAIDYRHQAVPNGKKYWGSVPLKDIVCKNDDGSTTIIPKKNSDYT